MNKTYMEKFLAQGHTPIMDGDDVDMFVTDFRYCNGPGCSVCGFTECWHCNHECNDIPKCCS